MVQASLNSSESLKLLEQRLIFFKKNKQNKVLPKFIVKNCEIKLDVLFPGGDKSNSEERFIYKTCNLQCKKKKNQNYQLSELPTIGITNPI